MDNEPSFFDFAAEVGLTKHIGGMAATEELAALCRIGPGTRVLDVGCGVGLTACHLAKKHGCQVTGVDISERMVQRSRERAEREGLGAQVEFRAADAQDLPFPAATFDAVITESVTAFPDDKAISEYARVVRPGGHVGLNESVWLKSPPPPHILAWVAQDVLANVQPLPAEGWLALLAGAGLQDVTGKAFPIDTRDEANALVGRYGWPEALRIVGRMLRLYLTNPAYRRFVRRTKETGVLPPDLAEFFGYGLFVGRRPG